MARYPFFLNQPADRITPGWTVQEKDLAAKCPTCKKRIPGFTEGLLKHLQQAHGVKPPVIRHEEIA